MELMRFAHFAEEDGCAQCEAGEVNYSLKALELLSDYELSRQFRHHKIAQNILDYLESASSSDRVLVVLS